MSATYSDIVIGESHEFGSYEVTREEIRSFAEQYDPQSFHTDEEAAQESMFGELVASGWHTAAMTMRMLVDNYLSDSEALGSPGVDAIRWTQPVRSGDVLSVRLEHTDKEPWDEDRGVVHTSITTVNQDDEPVFTMDAMTLYPRH